MKIFIIFIILFIQLIIVKNIFTQNIQIENAFVLKVFALSSGGSANYNSPNYHGFCVAGQSTIGSLNSSAYSGGSGYIPTDIEKENPQSNANLIKTFELYQNYPNPFNPTTTIKYQLPRASQVKIEIYNILGQKVRTLVNKKQKPGKYEVVWNGRNDTGTRVGSGMYLYYMRAGDFTDVKKMLLLR